LDIRRHGKQNGSDRRWARARKGGGGGGDGGGSVLKTWNDEKDGPETGLERGKANREERLKGSRKYKEKRDGPGKHEPGRGRKRIGAGIMDLLGSCGGSGSLTEE